MQNKLLESIGFDDSEIISFMSKKSNLTVFLKTWNEDILEIEFTDCILFLTYCSRRISQVIECSHSNLFQTALEVVYTSIPKDHPYKLFHFIDIEGEIALEIASANLNIKRHPLQESNI